ncbi:hypothetical protein M9H77_01092 [Catharanthus roseus]|uniref:Uncharacterized protein n=1 Tax=Catharanthus roseus TaxID=4058 RepID=A0ACC0C4J5_CATRO|nr:hypothetical protein M9H77_01092 [Catharanthus roseus]
MSLHIKSFSVLISVLLCLILNSSYFSNAAETDVNCLRAIKESLQDPLNYLSSWNFTDNTEGFICRFVGIECWNAAENRVLNIRLSDMGLKGEFPRGIANCTSLTGLDLSNNSISGSIPSDISMIMRFVTSLDLSYNRLSGSIPVSLANCSYLNVVKLENNLLSGQIPQEIGMLVRLKTFNVSYNNLTGPVPKFRNANARIGAGSYANNPGLCGSPLPPCRASAAAAKPIGQET